MTTLASTARVVGADRPGFEEILNPEAIDFVVTLDSRFAARRSVLLAARRVQRMRLLSGAELDFLPSTATVREDSSWRVASPAPGLLDRRVEITGPPERKMTVNALNSGAKVWLADFEDANSPTWDNVVGGQRNLLDAVRRNIDFTTDSGKRYTIGADPATIVVRPRGLHLVEKHLLVDGRPMSASIVDFGLYLFHCARPQLDAGSGPYFYLPKLEHHLEARWWNEVFLAAQELLSLPPGTVRATTLIETIPAAFQMEEILYELRAHSAGLNAGRWDYLFSIIKNLGNRRDFVLPDRAKVTMTAPFMRAYARLLVDTCHRRGASAIGGMAASIPSRDPAANEIAFAKVRDDKQREAEDGFDGSWVAHPGLVEACRKEFDVVLGDHPNQIDRPRPAVRVTPRDLLDVAATPGGITLDGVRVNVSVALRYLDSWLRGTGAAAIDGLMEDAATAEISRCQLSQWIQQHAVLADGSTVTAELVRAVIDEETARARTGVTSRLDEAREILAGLVLRDPMPDFFTTCAYSNYLVRTTGRTGQEGGDVVG